MATDPGVQEISKSKFYLIKNVSSATSHVLTELRELMKLLPVTFIYEPI